MISQERCRILLPGGGVCISLNDVQTERMQIGFNEDEIRAFLPRSYRKQELKEARMRAGIS